MYLDFAMILKQGEKDYTSDFVAAAEDGDCHCFVAADGRDSSDAAKMAAETVVEEFSAYDNTRGRKVHILCYCAATPDRLEGLCKN